MTLATVGFELIAVFEEAHGKGSFGFLAADQQCAVLAFRGTEPSDRTNIIDDARFLPRTWSVNGRAMGRVHSGFADALQRIWSFVGVALQDLTTPVWCTGHSLGGALATLAASRAEVEKLITFGSPRVGDAAFRDMLATHVPAAKRYVNCSDAVPQVPPAPYRHYGVLHYIDRHGDIHVQPKKRWMIADQAAAHTEYLRDYAWRSDNLVSRALADHALVNYVTAVAVIDG